MWLILALVAPAFYAGANIFDNFLSREKIKNPVALLFYAALFSAIFIPFVLVFNRVEIPSARESVVIVLLGFTNVAYLYPYYRGLQTEDTSVAVSFFALGRIFIPILAYFIVGEVLSVPKYFGIALIVASSVLLSVNKSKARIRFSKALFYIAIAAFITSFEGVLFKYLFEQGLHVGTVVAGQMVMSLFFSCALLVPSRTRKDIFADFRTFKSILPLFFAEEGFTWAAIVVEGYAIKIAPVSLVKSLTLFIPFYVLFIAKIFKRRLPVWFKEEVAASSMLKKIVLFSTMVAGAILIGF